MPDEEDGAKLFFKLANGVAGGRLGNAHFVRGATDAPVLLDKEEAAKTDCVTLTSRLQVHAL